MELFKVVLSDGTNVQKAGDTKFAPLDEECAKAVAQTVEAEAADWRLCVNNEWMRSNDIYDTQSSGSSQDNKNFGASAFRGC